MTDTKEHWRLCSICKTPIPFSALYWACSVSTCNRKRTRLTFCSVPCWDAHVPTMRHRDAWAVEETAPSREDWEAEQAAEKREAPSSPGRPAVPRPREGARRIVALVAAESSAVESSAVESSAVESSSMESSAVEREDLSEDHPTDVLIVASKLKAYIKARGGMRTSDGVLPMLSDLVRAAADEAIHRAREDERQTVLDRDVPEGWSPE